MYEQRGTTTSITMHNHQDLTAALVLSGRPAHQHWRPGLEKDQLTRIMMLTLWPGSSRRRFQTDPS